MNNEQVNNEMYCDDLLEAAEKFPAGTEIFLSDDLDLNTEQGVKIATMPDFQEDFFYTPSEFFDEYEARTGDMSIRNEWVTGEYETFRALLLAHAIIDHKSLNREIWARRISKMAARLAHAII